ncbi:hypothetical protein [Paenibacillus sp. DMB5]|uniref:hypothetical protein n=1 Tax=Paenibacillus sp. DMB5 TaxID=1780103 RepID=UPI000FE14389|nr:hypothetical protein [Paenibacillus sp. DMB5]
MPGYRTVSTTADAWLLQARAPADSGWFRLWADIRLLQPRTPGFRWETPELPEWSAAACPGTWLS